MRVLLYAVLGFGLAISSFGQKLPRQAAPWSIKTLDNKTVTLQQYKGKPVVVAFMLSTCEHCQKLVSQMNAIQAEFGPKGVVFLAGVVDATKTVGLSDFVKRFPPQFPLGTMDESMLLSFGQYGRDKVSYYPMLFFVDRWGTLRTQYQGTDNLFKGDQFTNIRGEVGRLAAMTQVAALPAAGSAPAPAKPAAKK